MVFYIHKTAKPTTTTTTTTTTAKPTTTTTTKKPTTTTTTTTTPKVTKPVLPKNYACQEKKEAIELACPAGKAIHVKYANYGRQVKNFKVYL